MNIKNRKQANNNVKNLKNANNYENSRIKRYKRETLQKEKNLEIYFT